MLLYTHSVWGTVLDEFFGANGWNTAEVVSLTREKGFFPSLWWYVPTDSMHLVHYLCNAVIVLFILGFGGRITSLLTWAIAVSYAHRASPANFGLDQINCLLTLYLTVGPSTQFLSLDRWLRRKMGKTNEQLECPSASANVALRLIQLHFCVIYLWAGVSKLQGEAWWNGNAMWLALASYEYQSMDLTWMARYPRLLEFVTHLTIAWEISFPFLVWPKPTRWIALGLGAAMHLGICMFLGMWTFGSIMVFSYIAFSSGAWIRKRFWTRPEAAFSREADSIATTAMAEESISHPQPEDSRDNSPTLVNLQPSNLSSAGSMKTVVLVSDSQRCIDHFLRLNRNAGLNWIAAANIKEAEKLVHLLPEAAFLLLDMRKLDDETELEYLSIRTLRVKRTSKKIHTDAGSLPTHRIHPK